MGDDRRAWWILGAASCVLGLVVLDETVVGVALPTIQHDLSMSTVGAHWVVNAYLLTFTCLVAVGGRLSDLLDRRTVFVLGAVLFALGSALAGAAPSGAWLITARALQGVGAAILFPSSLAIITASIEPARRGGAFAIQTTIGGLFMSSGPLVGGVFAETISWRWIFWINLPIVAAIAAIIMMTLRPSGRTESKAGSGFDRAGPIALVVSLTAIVVGLMQSSEWGWSAPAVWLLLVGGLVLLAAFVRIESTRSDPLIDLDLLRIAPFTGGALVFAAFQFEKMIVFIFLALYLQQQLDWSPIDAGLIVTIAVLPTLITSRLSGRLRDRLGARVPLTVTLLLTGAAIFAIALGTVYGNLPLIILVLILWGAIMPAIAVCARAELMSAVPEAQRGQAGGVNLTIQMLGGTIGVAICGALLATTGSFPLVFLVTGGLVILSAWIAWLTFRPTAPARSRAA